MKPALLLTACLLCMPALAHESSEGANKITERDLREFTAMLPGLYTNEEQTYFQDNLELPKSDHLPRLDLLIKADGDAFIATTFNPKTGERTKARLTYRVEDGHIRSREIRDGQADCERTFTRSFESYRGEGCGAPVIASPDGFIFGTAENPFHMRRTSPFTCWVAPRKRDESYGFVNDVVIHDGGGREWIKGEDFDTVGIRMRHVRWPMGNNRDSLVLYLHKGEDADWETAESYAWTEPDSDRIAVNLRWVQVSCTRGGETITPGINLKTGSGK